MIHAEAAKSRACCSQILLIPARDNRRRSFPVVRVVMVLEGRYGIQGLVDEADHEIGRTSLSVSPADKGHIPIKEDFHKRPESGACNVCSAPCSSCMHANRGMPFIESNVEGDCSRKDSYSFIDTDEHSSITNDLQVKSVHAGHASLEMSSLKRESSGCHADLMKILAERTFVIDCVGELNSTGPTINVCNKGAPVKCNIGSPSPSRNNTCQESKDGIDTAICIREVGNSCIASNLSDKSATLWDRLEKKLQSLSEGESSELEKIEEDDKVCDICGDAGRENSLAICSRCSDGAEHTYCMKIKLEKVPEGEWSCEECKLKEESETQRMNKIKLVSKITERPLFKETDENSDIDFNTMVLHKLGKKTNSSVVEGSHKGQRCLNLANKKQADQMDPSQLPGKRPPEPFGVSVEAASPRKRVSLSKKGILRNLDSGKLNPSNIVPTTGSQQCSFGPKQLKSQPLRGSTLRSSSFKNGSSIRGKVKQLTRNIPASRNTKMEISPRGTRKAGHMGVLRKNTLFRRISSGFSNADILNKTQGLNSSCSDGPIEPILGKGRAGLEKNNFSLEYSLACLASSSLGGVPSKFDIKESRLDGKSNNTSESNALGMSRGLETVIDARHPLRRSQSCLSKSPLKGPGDSLGQKQFQVPKEISQASSTGIKRPSSHCILPRALSSSMRNENSKDSDHLGTRQARYAGDRAVCCQRCGETDHATQFCPIDKLRVSSLKPSLDQSLKECTSTRNVQTAKILTSEPEELKVGILPEQREDLDVTNGDMYRVKDAPDGRDISKNIGASAKENDPVFDTIQKNESWNDLFTSRAVGSNALDFDAKHCYEALRAPFFPSNKPRPSVIPELEFIWRGDFEVLRGGKMSSICAGIQAHLSTCVSPKVFSVVDKFSDKVILEEVPCSYVWPSQFHSANPKEDHIALFFFARDIESYERHYQKLLCNMLKNNLALKGIICGVDLLIFASDMLPENFQRWNNLFFLWGVFRVRNGIPQALNKSQDKCCNSTLVEPLIQQSDSHIQPIFDGKPEEIQPSLTSRNLLTDHASEIGSIIDESEFSKDHKPHNAETDLVALVSIPKKCTASEPGETSTEMGCHNREWRRERSPSVDNISLRSEGAWENVVQPKKMKLYRETEVTGSSTSGEQSFIPVDRPPATGGSRTRDAVHVISSKRRGRGPWTPSSLSGGR